MKSSKVLIVTELYDKSVDLFIDWIHSTGNLFLRTQYANSTWSLHDTLTKLNELGCQAIEIRFLDEIDVLSLLETLREFSDSRFKVFFVYLKYTDGVFPELAANLFLNFRRIVKLVFHSAPENMENLYPQTGHEFLNQAIKARKNRLDSHAREVHSKKDFVVNMELFTESIHFHPGFNRKVCIDKTGLVKNYITHPNNYGHISNVNLKSLAKNDSFCELWKVTHDQIEGCRVCCYRYMCVDNVPVVCENNDFKKLEFSCR